MQKIHTARARNTADDAEWERLSGKGPGAVGVVLILAQQTQRTIHENATSNKK